MIDANLPPLSAAIIPFPAPLCFRPCSLLSYTPGLKGSGSNSIHPQAKINEKQKENDLEEVGERNKAKAKGETHFWTALSWWCYSVHLHFNADAHK